MKSERNILIAFILNLCFSIFEFLGGIFTRSVAIMSDAIHDIGDAASIGFSYFLEKKAKKQPDNSHTYGYARYSMLGGVITSLILLIGSVIVITNSVKRILNPVEINYDGMILFGLAGVVINFTAAYFTHGGESINQKAVNLHMLEDVLGWAVVLVGAVVMRFTNFSLLDPIISICVAIFILVSTLKNLKVVLDIFLEKAPSSISIQEIKDCICKIDGILDVHHIHLRQIDEHNLCATMHVVTDCDTHSIKKLVRQELANHGVAHTTLELETGKESCHNKECFTVRCHHHDNHSHHHSH